MNIEDDDKLPRAGQPPEEKSGGRAASAPETAGTEEADGGAAGARPKKPELTRPRKSLVLLNMFLSLVLFATVGWLLLEQQQTIDALFSQQNSLLREVQDNASATGAIENMQNRLASAEEMLEDAGLKIEEQNQQLVLASRQLQVQREQLASVRQQLESQEGRVARLDEDLVNTRLQLSSARSPVADINQQWLLSEAEALVRLAQQQLTVSRDVRAAVSLLASADAVLERIGSNSVPPIRDALAADMASLQALPDTDPQLVHRQLSELADRAVRLPLARVANPAAPAADGGARQENAGYLAALREALEEFVTVRRLDEPVQPLLTTEEGYYVKQNLRLQLEQAALALLGNRPEIYAESLAGARATIEEYLGEDGGEKRAILDVLDRLAEARITRELPDVSSTLAAFRQALSGGEAAAGGP